MNKEDINDENPDELTPEESFDESINLWDNIEEALERGDDDIGVSLVKKDKSEIGSQGDYVKKQSSLGSNIKRYLTKPSIVELGSVLNHPTHGNGTVIEAYKKSGENIITVKVANGDEITVAGTDDDIIDFFKLSQQKGDVVSTPETPDTEMTIIEELPEGKVKVKDRRTGEEKIVDKGFVQPKTSAPLKKKIVKLESYSWRVYDKDREWKKDYHYDDDTLVKYANYLEKQNGYNEVIDNVDKAIEILKTDYNLGVEKIAIKKIAQQPEEVQPKQQQQVPNPNEPEVEKTTETKPEVKQPVEQPPSPDKTSQEQQPQEQKNIYKEMIKNILKDPDVAPKVVDKIVELAVNNPEVLTKLDSLIPDPNIVPWTSAKWMKINGEKFASKIISVVDLLK